MCVYRVYNEIHWTLKSILYVNCINLTLKRLITLKMSRKLLNIASLNKDCECLCMFLRFVSFVFFVFIVAAFFLPLVFIISHNTEMWARWRQHVGNRIRKMNEWKPTNTQNTHNTIKYTITSDHHQRPNVWLLNLIYN